MPGIEFQPDRSPPRLVATGPGVRRRVPAPPRRRPRVRLPPPRAGRLAGLGGVRGHRRGPLPLRSRPVTSPTRATGSTSITTCPSSIPTIPCRGARRRLRPRRRALPGRDPRGRRPAPAAQRLPVRRGGVLVGRARRRRPARQQGGMVAPSRLQPDRLGPAPPDEPHRVPAARRRPADVRQPGVPAAADQRHHLGRGSRHRCGRQQRGGTVIGIGLALPQLGPVVSGPLLREFSQRAEEMGFAHLWVQDHFLYALQQEGEYGGSATSQPAAYQSVYAPTEVLAAVAAWTIDHRVRDEHPRRRQPLAGPAGRAVGDRGPAQRRAAPVDRAGRRLVGRGAPVRRRRPDDPGPAHGRLRPGPRGVLG